MGEVRVKDRQDVTIYRDEFAYASHPTVAKLHSGDYLVAFNESLVRQPFIHPPSDPRYVNLVSRSRDGGFTWETPRVAPGYEWTGVECPGITQISSGEVLLNQWQFKWYPLEAGRKLAARTSDPEEILVFDPARRQWRPFAEDVDWERSPFPWARGDSGCFVSVSRDDGATWDTTVKVDISPHRRGYSPRPPTELEDGTLLLSLGGHDAYRVIYVVRSTDRGKSWGRQVAVAAGSPEFSFCEPSILALTDGKVIVVWRENSQGRLCQSDSYDGGRTWTAIRRTEMWGYPCHLVRLTDGRILCIYGYRRPPYGIRACLSVDQGETWDHAHELIIRDDMKNSNLGYPTAIEEDDGAIFAAYYGENAEGVTYVMGSHFRLPN